MNTIRRLVSLLCFFLPSGATRVLFRIVGHTVGKHARLPPFSYLHARKMTIGNDVDVRPFVYIHVGDLALGANTIVSYGTQIRGHRGFSTGDNCFIGPHTLIHCEENVRFGFYSGVGPGSMIYTHGSFLPVTKGYPAKFGEVVLEDYVWVAMGVIFMPGAWVGSNTIVNSGVVVSGRIPADTLVQVSTTATDHLDLAKLRRFSRRATVDYQKQIIEAFLESRDEDPVHDVDRCTYSGSSGLQFRYTPESATIELRLKDRLLATYDLERYYTSRCPHRVHRSFLSFLRRRFGISLRTEY